MPNFTNTLDLTGMELKQPRQAPGLFWYPADGPGYLPRPFRGSCPLEAFQVYLSHASIPDDFDLTTLHSLSLVSRDFWFRSSWMLDIIADRYHSVGPSDTTCRCCDCKLRDDSSLLLCANCQGGICQRCVVISTTGRRTDTGEERRFCLCYFCVDDLEPQSDFAEVARTLNEQAKARRPRLRHCIERRLLPCLEDLYLNWTVYFQIRLVDFSGRGLPDYDYRAHVITMLYPRVDGFQEAIREFLSDRARAHLPDPFILFPFLSRPVALRDVRSWRQFFSRKQALVHSPSQRGHGGPMQIKVLWRTDV